LSHGQGPLQHRVRTIRPEVWKIVRDFNNYPVWVGGAGESEIEDGKSGDTVGAVVSVLYQGRHIRQRLLAQSDVEHSQTYEFCGAPSLPVTGFQATLRIVARDTGWPTVGIPAGKHGR
jgi:hypothetical protein